MRTCELLIGCGLLAIAGNVMAALDPCPAPNTALATSGLPYLFNYYGQRSTILQYPVYPNFPDLTQQGTASCAYVVSGQSINGQIFPFVDGVPRSALVRLPPAGVSTTSPPPVVFAFHGAGTSYACGTALAMGTEIHVAWPQALVIYPDGLANAYTSPLNPTTLTSSSIATGYSSWSGPSAYVGAPAYPSTNPLPDPGSTLLPGNFLGQGQGWQWVLGMTPAVAANGTAGVAPGSQGSSKIYPAMLDATTLDLDFIDQTIAFVAAQYGTTPSNLNLYAVGHSMGSAFTGLLYNLSSGLPSPQLGNKSYPNFQQFKAFAFNDVMPDSAYTAFFDTSDTDYNSSSGKPVSQSTTLVAGYTAPYPYAYPPSSQGMGLGAQIIANDGNAAPTDLILGNTVPFGYANSGLANAGPIKPMLMSLDCYDTEIPYQISYESVINARNRLGITSVTNSNLSDPSLLSDLKKACTTMQGWPASSNGLPGTAMVYDEEMGTTGAELEVIVHTEYANAASATSGALYKANGQTIGFPADGHFWPIPETLVQNYGCLQAKNCPSFYSNGTVATSTGTGTIQSPQGLTWMVVQFFQKVQKGLAGP